jgi:Ser/Thr protein kinase RdoA (MazF antagonist)
MSWVASADPRVPELLRTHYGRTAVSVRRLDRESVNEMFRVRTSDEELVVKRLGRLGSAEWLNYQADVLDTLSEHGFPVRPWLRSLDGHGTTRIGDDQWQVARFAESRPFVPGDAADVTSAAACLDHLHQLTDLVPADSPRAPIQDAEPWLCATEADMAELADTVHQVAPADAGGYVATYRDIWTRAQAELSGQDYLALPRRITHGEYVSSNVLYGQDGVLAVIDWDAVQVRPRVSDVARGALFFARRARGGIEVFDELVPVFLRRATESAPLSDAEFAALIPFLECYFLPSPGYLRMLAEHEPDMLTWYLGWSSAGAARVRPLLTPILGARV